MLNEQVLLLSKKHGQLKQATTKMVQVVMGFINEVTNAEKKLSVIETLRTVTEGKVLWMPSAVWGTKLIQKDRFSWRLRERESREYCQT